MFTATLMLLGSGELGREFTIAAKRLGCRIIACDRYANAPAMQMADACEVFPMLDGKALRAAVEKHRPDVIVPEIEAIDTATLAELEREGWRVAPSAKAVQLTMNRDGIRDFAARELGLVTSKYRFAESREEAIAAADAVGLPCVVKPVMSSSGKGQSTAEDGRRGRHGVGLCRREDARRPPASDRRGIHQVRQRDHAAHGRDQGRHPVLPAGRPPPGSSAIIARAGSRRTFPDEALQSARFQARKVVEALGGHGIFGVEFFVRGDQAIFSELSPRPHDTGMVTLISQFPNQFELHLRAILGLPIRSIEFAGPSASAVILADRECADFSFEDWRKHWRSAPPAGRWTSAFSPSPTRSRTGAWALRSPATTVPRTRSRAPRLQPRASRFVIGDEGATNDPHP